MTRRSGAGGGGGRKTEQIYDGSRFTLFVTDRYKDTARGRRVRLVCVNSCFLTSSNQ